MRAMMMTIGVFAASALLMPAAFAEDTAKPPPRGNGKPAPACCNPAASDQTIKPPPGVYVGMPLQPGDLGYTPKKNKEVGPPNP